MTTGTGAKVFALKLERTYLAALRVLILVFATICLLGAGAFVIDGIRRALLPTEVKAAPVAVSAQEAVAPIVRSPTDDKASTSEAGYGVSAEAKAAHAAFMKGPFESYYQAYRKLAQTYNKPEDQVHDKRALAERLGYTPDALDAAPNGAAPQESGTDAASIAAAAAADAAAAAANAAGISSAYEESMLRTSAQFQRDADYAKAQTDVVAKALADPRLIERANKYKAAQKTAQACSTVHRMRTVWDPNSTGCEDWFYRPYGCSVRRAVPVEECVPAYPEGIESPIETFARLDESYRMQWFGKMAASQGKAASEEALKKAIKAEAPMSLWNGLRVFGAFLVVMFMFLLIAIERHLRPAEQSATE